MENRAEMTPIGQTFVSRGAIFSPRTGCLSTSNGSYTLGLDKFTGEWSGECNDYIVIINRLSKDRLLMEW